MCCWELEEVCLPRAMAQGHGDGPCQLHVRVYFQKTNLAHLSRAFSEGKRNFIPLAICYEHKNNPGGAHQAESFCPQARWHTLQWSEAPPAISLKGHWELIAMTPCPWSLHDSWARLPGLSKHFTCTKLPHSTFAMDVFYSCHSELPETGTTMPRYTMGLCASYCAFLPSPSSLLS